METGRWEKGGGGGAWGRVTWEIRRQGESARKKMKEVPERLRGGLNHSWQESGFNIVCT